MHIWPIARGATLLSALAGIILVAGTVRAAEKADAKPPVALCEVQTVLDIPYYQGKDADPIKHKLDLFLPKDRKDFPVLFFVHGGSWRHGDKGFLGMYSTLGTFLARHGIGAVVINYRLTPAVTHPEHIKDVARAFAWTYRNIAKYGGRSDEIFVSGHSAGGHLIALLATDDAYLKAEGLGLETIRGAIPISGVYRIPEGNRVFDAVFGTDPKARKEAGPVCHVRPDAPPFLIIYADKDFAVCGQGPSEEFCQALRLQKSPAESLEVKHRNHLTVLLDATTDADPAARAILDFIARHTQKPRG